MPLDHQIYDKIPIQLVSDKQYNVSQLEVRFEPRNLAVKPVTLPLSYALKPWILDLGQVGTFIGVSPCPGGSTGDQDWLYPI